MVIRKEERKTVKVILEHFECDICHEDTGCHIRIKFCDKHFMPTGKFDVQKDVLCRSCFDANGSILEEARHLTAKYNREISRLWLRWSHLANIERINHG